jgi:type I restriction enzyme R subunit
MLLTGFDSPPPQTMYADKPMRGAALMQALARVNRTFRNKQDGLLVGYAPLTENLFAALAEYTARDQNTKPMGKDIEDAVAKVKDMLAVIGDEILAGFDWRTRRAAKGPRAYWNAVTGAVDYLRNPATPGNQVEEGKPNLAEFRDDIAFFEEVRMLNARFDAEERKARGETVPPDVELYLKSLTGSAIEAGGVTTDWVAKPSPTTGLPRPNRAILLSDSQGGLN